MMVYWKPSIAVACVVLGLIANLQNGTTPSATEHPTRCTVTTETPKSDQDVLIRLQVNHTILYLTSEPERPML